MTDVTTLHLGGYTTGQEPGRSGLARVSLDAGGFGPVRALAGPADCSWLVPAPTGRLYAVSEGEDGQVVELAMEPGGAGEGDEVRVVGRASSGGSAPAHLALSPDGGLLVASNYLSGTVGLLRAGPAGPELLDVLALSGSGPHPRQDGPHAHQAAFVDARRLLVTDLGSDTVHEVLVEGDRLRAVGGVRLPAGSGPRHLALAPGRDDLFWVVGELDLSVRTVRRSGSGWEVSAAVALVPEGAGPGGSTAAGIVAGPDGAHVYVSTRGEDTVSAFAAPPDGALVLRQRVLVDRWPRFLGWVPGHEGRQLLVAAEHEGSVDVWDVVAGLLRPSGHSLAWVAPTWAG